MSLDLKRIKNHKTFTEIKYSTYILTPIKIFLVLILMCMNCLYFFLKFLIIFFIFSLNIQYLNDNKKEEIFLSTGYCQWLHTDSAVALSSIEYHLLTFVKRFRQIFFFKYKNLDCSSVRLRCYGPSGWKHIFSSAYPYT